jgi:hypothetical protein
MKFLPVPKLMQWQPSLDQSYVTAKSTLITSGCSFTSSTGQLEAAASWPGYVKDRCRFDKVFDYSIPGAGNEYIHDSIRYHFDNLSPEETDQCMAIVMWSGLDRKEKKLSTSDKANEGRPPLNDTVYVRENLDFVRQLDKKILAQESAEFIFDLQAYLKSKNIPFVFSFYCNLLFGPYIPKSDTTFEFDKFVSRQTLSRLQSLSWIPGRPMDFLYEYAFVNDFLNDGDGFHPPVECIMKWTDEILLPGMCKQGVIQSV